MNPTLLPLKLRCNQCETAFDTLLIPSVHGWIEYCSESCEEEAREQAINTVITKVDSIFELILPRWFMMHRCYHPRFNGAFWDSIYQWEPRTGVPFLGLCGDVGVCMGGCAYLMFEETITDDIYIADPHYPGYRIPTFAVVRAAAFSVGVDIGFRDVKDVDILERLCAVDYLLVENLGDTKHTPETIDNLLQLFLARRRSSKMTIWTSSHSFDKLTHNLGMTSTSPLIKILKRASHIAEVPTCS